jgi:hypothetical protein
MLSTTPIRDSVRLALVCVPLWASCFLVAAQPKPIVTADLLPKGLPADFKGYSFNCPYHYPGYYSLQWIDRERVLVAFSTSPICGKKVGSISGVLRLITFDLRGNMVRSADVPYDAGTGTIYVEPDLRHDGVWIGPEQSLLVEFRGGYSKTQPNSRGKILVLSSELLPQQEIETYPPRDFYDGIHLERVTPDHHAVLFWTSAGTREKQKCLVFSGRPLVQTSGCLQSDLNVTDPSDKYWGSARAPLPKGHETLDSAGSTIDGDRVAVMGAKVAGFCEAWGMFCPSREMLIVFEVVTKRVVFRMKLPTDGSARATLSTDGKHIAVVEHERLEIFALPD